MTYLWVAWLTSHQLMDACPANPVPVMRMRKERPSPGKRISGGIVPTTSSHTSVAIS